MATIYIVDDDVNTCNAIAGLLTQSGHTCQVFPRAGDVMEAARKNPPDVFILDVMLPDISGFELCRRIRRDAELFQIPILIISAMDGKEEIHHGLSQGADDYIVKPVQPQNLLQRLTGVLHLRQADMVDAEVGLPSATAIKREVQRRFVEGDAFYLGSVEISGIREYRKLHGLEKQKKLIRHAGRLLTKCADRIQKDAFYIGHMGGGYFIFIAPVSNTKKFCKMVRATWKEHINSLEKDTHGNFPELLICVVGRHTAAADSAQDLFNIITQIRHKALSSKGSGIFVDHRVNTPS